VEKSSPNLCATSVIFETLPKVNSRPTGENSPNLVTLILGSDAAQWKRHNNEK
jgi:hypothetical protein